MQRAWSLINLSLGMRRKKAPKRVGEKAVKAGIVVVVAAGNYGAAANGTTVYGTILTPGIEPSVITVGAVTTWGTLACTAHRAAPKAKFT